MTNKVVSVKSVLKYAFSPLFKGNFSVLWSLGLFPMLVAGSLALPLFIVSGALQVVIPLAAQLVSLVATALMSALMGSIMFRVALLVYDKADMSQAKKLPSLDIFLRFFAVTLFSQSIQFLIQQFGMPLKLASSWVTVPLLIVLFVIIVAVGYRISLYGFFIVEGSSVIDSFRKSWKTTQGHLLKLIACCTGMTAIILLTAIPLVLLGLLVSKLTGIFSLVFIIMLVFALMYWWAGVMTACGLIMASLYRQFSAETK